MTRGCSFHFILPQICYNTISYSHAISCYFNIFHWFWSQPKSMDTLGHQCRALGAAPVPWNQRWRGRALQRPRDRRSAARCRCAGNDTAESAHSQPLDSIRYMVYNGYYKVMSNIPKMGHLTTPDLSVSKRNLLLNFSDQAIFTLRTT